MPDIFDTAEELYENVRAQDAKLSAIEDRVRFLIHQLTGYHASNVGSFGLLLNLPGSDLDLAIGVTAEDRACVLEACYRHGMTFKGERQTSATTTRKVFEFLFEDVAVDLGILPKGDFDLLVPCLERCRKEMTHGERIEHVWKKWRLKQEGRQQEYAELKLEPYARFCPSFLWRPIL